MTTPHAIATRREWLEARTRLLHEEKEFTRRKDELAARRRELPWVQVEENYVFQGADGPTTLADLFDGRSQLLIYHFMFAPDWSQGCKSCSLVADHYEPAIIHLQQRDVSLATVSRAPIEKLLAFRERMGWRFRWVSSGGNTFNRDYGVHFTDAERESGLAIYNYESPPYPISDLPGLSAFIRGDDGTIYHTYSTYARGLDQFLNVYNLLDVAPKGRDEAGLETMSWVRHRDRYGLPGFIDPWAETPAVKEEVR
ncbi:MAG TPA: thioredoxin family protein [Pirellulales bacterium]